MIYFVKTCPEAKTPTYATEGAAAMDLYALTDGTVEILPGQTVMIGTGIKMAIPKSKVGLLFARSGLACKQGLAPANKVGVIDSDYRGEVKVALYNQSNEVRTVNCGDRIAQMAIMDCPQYELIETDCIDDTERAEGGFGSTGL